jgi:hypothetical protein
MIPYAIVRRAGLRTEAVGSLIAANLTACAVADAAPSPNASVPLLQPSVACSDVMRDERAPPAHEQLAHRRSDGLGARCGLSALASQDGRSTPDSLQQ